MQQKFSNNKVLREQDWRWHETYKAQEFFDMLIKKYLSLELVSTSEAPLFHAPVPFMRTSDHVRQFYVSGTDVHEHHKQYPREEEHAIYRDCGWPELQKFRKVECLARLKKLDDDRWEERMRNKNT